MNCESFVTWIYPFSDILQRPIFQQHIARYETTSSIEVDDLRLLDAVETFRTDHTMHPVQSIV